MLTVWGEQRGKFCDGLSRRSFLKAGALAVGGLALADVLRLKAQGSVEAGAADKLAFIRNMKFQQQGHTPPELYSGFLDGKRPSIGSVVSKLRTDAGRQATLPPYVYLGDGNYVGGSGFLGVAHQAYQPGSRAGSLGLARDMTLDRLADRRKLLRSFDGLRHELDDARRSLAGMDAFAVQAMEMISTDKARDAFDISKEP